jgi:hypothetical protein
MAAALFREWQARAAALGLDPGDAADVGEAAFAADVVPAREFGPFTRAEAPLILARLEGMARRRRSAWRVEVSNGTLTIRADPAGRSDDLQAGGPLVADLRVQARALRDDWLRCQSIERQAAGDQLETIAAALGVSLATLQRARRGVTEGPDLTRDMGQSGVMIETTPARCQSCGGSRRGSLTERIAN